MDRTPLISIIMPARNAGAHIGQAIASVMAQSWSNWELIIIDNGSTDDTQKVISQFEDPRLITLHEPVPGVSRARNKGLEVMRGQFYSFLDADDVLPPRSLEARAGVLMNDPLVCFADGYVDRLDHHSGALTPLHRPTLRGDAFPALMVLSGSAFAGPSWMIRRMPGTTARFPEHMTHAEDLAYYLTIARAGPYAYTQEIVLHYRSGHGSAMSDIKALDKGYIDLYQHAATLAPPPSAGLLIALWKRIERVMFRGFLKRLMPLSALRVLLRARPQAEHRS
jgi:glycosyltransferase involved in cell wall biosynthesis